MKKITHKYLIYSTLYLFIASLLLFSLVINIKTLPLIEETNKIKHKISQLQQDNLLLQIHIHNISTLENIDLKAQELGLVKPSKMEYKRVP